MRVPRALQPYLGLEVIQKPSYTPLRYIGPNQHHRPPRPAARTRWSTFQHHLSSKPSMWQRQKLLHKWMCSHYDIVSLKRWEFSHKHFYVFVKLKNWEPNSFCFNWVELDSWRAGSNETKWCWGHRSEEHSHDLHEGEGSRIKESIRKHNSKAAFDNNGWIRIYMAGWTQWRKRNRWKDEEWKDNIPVEVWKG